MKYTDLRLKCDKCNTEAGQPYNLLEIKITGKHSITTEYACKCLNCGNDFKTIELTECEHMDTSIFK